MKIPTNPNQNITINDEQLKQTHKFTYFGSIISSRMNKVNIKSRIDNLVGLLSTVYKNGKLVTMGLEIGEK